MPISRYAYSYKRILCFSFSIELKELFQISVNLTASWYIDSERKRRNKFYNPYHVFILLKWFETELTVLKTELKGDNQQNISKFK